jgi:hypothetical protein
MQPPEPSRTELLALSASLSATPAHASNSVAAAASALVEIRERLSLAAPAPRLRRLAFGKAFVVQLTTDAAIVRSTPDGKELFRAPIADGRAALGLPNGSVLVLAAHASYRIDPGQTVLHPRTRISLLPGALVEPSRENAEFVWVLEPWRKTVLRYTLSPDAGLGLIAERELSSFDARAFTTLIDGSFLYSAGADLAHARPFSKPRLLSLPADVRLWRLAAADRVDTAWAATTSGDLLRLELGAHARVLQTLRTGRAPVDLAVAPKRLALLSVTEAPKATREFVLSVYSNDGRQLFSRPVGKAAASPSAGWAADALRDQELVIGSQPALVAVGGAGALRLYDLDTGVERIPGGG